MPRHPQPVDSLFWAKVDASGDCWEWMGHRHPKGYGLFGGGALSSYKRQRAHRYAWEALVGPIPDGLQIDHLCRNRACVNPDHLEVVDARTNIARGFSPAGINARSSACKHGHPWTLENTHRTATRRSCRLCNVAKSQKHYRKKKEAAGAH